MKAASAIGIGVAILGLLGGAMMEGTSPAAFLNIPALLLVLGGTTGVCMASTGMDAMKRIPSLYKIVVAGSAHDLGGKVVELVRFADRARRDGLLALEEELEGIDDLIGHGVYYGAGRSEAAQCAGQSVVVVGAGNSAGSGCADSGPHSIRARTW